MEEENKSVKVNTGLINSLNSFEALIFTDNTCPKCGEHTLDVETQEENEKNVMIRYRCSNCNYVCPISREHVTVGEEAEYRPGYDSSIKNFMTIFHKR